MRTLTAKQTKIKNSNKKTNNNNNTTDIYKVVLGPIGHKVMKWQGRMLMTETSWV